jgi:RNA polymerase sigma factor (sigma-70 family)
LLVGCVADEEKCMGGATLSLRKDGALAAPLRLLSDDRLARLAAQGNDKAFAVIFERHHQALYRYCRSILVSPEDSADALQNAMTSAFEAIGGERRELRIKPWLYRIAHNESISFLRRRRSHEDFDAVTNLSGPSLEAEVNGNARIRELVSDLRELPERQRGALLMRELNGLDYGEIAQALSVSAAAAKQAVYEARTALHEIKEGREMDCEAVRLRISENDGRLLRGRKVRSHLRACEGCCGFEATIKARRRDLAALAPPLPAGAAAALLSAILGTFGGGGGGGGIAAVAGGIGLKAAASSPAIKGAAAAVAACVIGGTATVVTKDIDHPSRGNGHPAVREAKRDKPQSGHNATPSARGAVIARPHKRPSGRAQRVASRHRSPAPASTPEPASDQTASEVPAPAAMPVSAPSPAPAPRPQAPTSPVRRPATPWQRPGSTQTTSYEPQLVQSLLEHFGEEIPTTVTALQQQFTAALGGSLPMLPQPSDWGGLLSQLLAFQP